MYGGQVKLVFDPNGRKYRYTVTDRVNGLTEEPMRGVTTILRDIIHKPDLMQWPMNMSHQYLFGQKFDEASKEYLYVADKAKIKADTPYTSEELQKFLQDGRKAHMKRSDYGKDVGTIVHLAIEYFLKDEDDGLKKALDEQDDLELAAIKAVTKAYGAFVDWWKSLPNAEVVYLERPVYSRHLAFAGTVDIVARVNGKLYLMDLKTTNSSGKAPLGIYAEYFMQMGGYSHALSEELDENFEDLVVVRASKEGELTVAAAGSDMKMSVADCEKAFAFSVRVHDWLEEMNSFLTDNHFKSNFISSVNGR